MAVLALFYYLNAVALGIKTGNCFLAQTETWPREATHGRHGNQSDFDKQSPADKLMLLQRVGKMRFASSLNRLKEQSRNIKVKFYCQSNADVFTPLTGEFNEACHSLMA